VLHDCYVQELPTVVGDARRFRQIFINAIKICQTKDSYLVVKISYDADLELIVVHVINQGYVGEKLNPAEIITALKDIEGPGKKLVDNFFVGTTHALTK
jgi:hypothetical protein